MQTGVRGLGNEHGSHTETTCQLMRDSVYAGMQMFSEKWATAKENGGRIGCGGIGCDFIRPAVGITIAYEDSKVKTLHSFWRYFTIVLEGTARCFASIFS